MLLNVLSNYHLPISSFNGCSWDLCFRTSLFLFLKLVQEVAPPRGAGRLCLWWLLMRLWGLLSRCSQGQACSGLSGHRCDGDDCGCEAAAPGSLGPFWLWMGCRMCFQGLGPGEQGPPARNTETHLSSGSQGQGSMVTDAVGDACRTRTSSAPMSPGQFLLFSPFQSTTITWSFCFLCQVIWCYLAS